MDAATVSAVKELKRIIKFVIKTKDYGIRIEPQFTNDWTWTIYTDSDWAGDKDNRHSITGFIIFFMNVPIFWKSKAQKAIALSSSEAEYYAMAEAAKEIRFIVQVLESLG
jgi:hypothetical protein